MNVVIVVGARPNFIKIAPLIDALKAHNIEYPARKIEYRLIHTGQHYDYQMSQVFFEDLNIPQPDIHLGVGSGTHAEQTGSIMIKIEKILLQEKPDLVIVVGDINSTLAAALAAIKLHIKIAHIEAGLRSWDFNYPEEVNRLLVDAVSTYLFTPCEFANDNLIKEGISNDRVFFVGNILADSIFSHLEIASKQQILSKLGLMKRDYAILTLHRPFNVDQPEVFLPIINTIKNVSKQIPIIFPVHPRSLKSIKEMNLESEFSWIGVNEPVPNDQVGVFLMEPLGYLNFLQMESNAKFIITDSGGVQAETTILNIPCLTLLSADIWPSTVTDGTNILVGSDPQAIFKESIQIINGKRKISTQLPLWDGKTAERIVAVLDRHLTL